MGCRPDNPFRNGLSENPSLQTIIGASSARYARPARFVAATFEHGAVRSDAPLIGQGAAMEDDDVAVDMALWTLLAAMAGFLAFGCMVTRKTLDGESVATRCQYR